MKNKRICFLVLFLIFISTLFIIGTTSYAGSQTMDNLTYEVTLNDDGSMDVIEVWDIDIYSTNTLFKTFELDSSKYGNITNVEVSEISKTGQISKFIKTDEYAYHVDKGYYYGLEVENDKFEIAWGVSINGSETKRYMISYKVEEAVRKYNDCSELYWQFIGTDNGIPVDNIKGTIKLPKAVLNKENIKVWGHGPLNGEIYAIDNETVSFEVGYLSTKEMVEIRIAVLEDIFPTNTNIINRNELENIIAEETEWADEANRERERLIREEKAEETIETLIMIGVIIIGAAILTFYVLKIIKYITELKKEEKTKPEEKIEYFRDFPDDSATAAEAAFLYYFDNKKDFNKNISKIVSATILNLSLKGAISFEEDKNEKVNIVIKENNKNLIGEEIIVYELLNNVLDYTNKKNKEENNKISMRDIEKYAKNNDRKFLSKVEGIEKTAINLQKTKKNYSTQIMEESEKWAKKKNTYFMCSLIFIAFLVAIVPLIAVIPSMICGFLCKALENKTRNLTQKGTNEKEKWEALKRYMENFSLLDEREVPELALWEKYLVYATSFGIADKVLEQLKIKYPELNDENFVMSNGYTYMYMNNRYNFNRVLTSSMQSAYNAGIRERNARQAAASSSYSSGGGGRTEDFPAEAGGGRSDGGRNGTEDKIRDEQKFARLFV